MCGIRAEDALIGDGSIPGATRPASLSFRDAESEIEKISPGLNLFYLYFTL